MNNNITKNWILAFTKLENVESFDICDGVLHVKLRWLEDKGDYRPDFLASWENEIPGFRLASLAFDLPLPECITSDGDADFHSLCEKAGGPDEIVWWRERLEMEAWNEMNARHERILVSAGDA